MCRLQLNYMCTYVRTVAAVLLHLCILLTVLNYNQLIKYVGATVCTYYSCIYTQRDIATNLYCNLACYYHANKK